ncbi:MAG: alpha/beta fold hydrolase [Terracoccus sp.]
MLSQLSPARRRLVMAVVALIVVVLTVVGAVVVVARRQAPAADQSTPGPVLLVPGYGGAQASLAPLAAALRATGRDVTIVGLPDRAQGDLAGQADALGTAVDAAMRRTGASSVDLVGYSAGGIVARLWVTQEGGAPRVRRLVTLGSPHHGTEVATVGSLVPGTCPTACQQLATDSPLLSQLDRDGIPTGVVFVSLWTTGDDVVVPPSSSVVDGQPSPSLQSICPGLRVNHGGLPGDPLAQSLVGAALGAGPLPTWSPADCSRLS